MCRVLPQQDAEDGERVEEHTRRVEQLMARELGVATSPHTSADKVEYAKRLLFIQPPPGNSFYNPQIIVKHKSIQCVSDLVYLGFFKI